MINAKPVPDADCNHRIIVTHDSRKLKVYFRTYIIQLFLQIAFGQCRHYHAVQRSGAIRNIQYRASTRNILRYFIGMTEYAHQRAISFC